ncbi:MAG: glycosyl hydrolase family 28-related protein [Ginsengibacter sp.]
MIKILLSLLIIFSRDVLYAHDVDITKYGALGDGTTLNTVFIQKAIDDCNAGGGGKVIFPAGKFLSGTIVLKDNVTIHLDKNALLLGSTNVDDYKNTYPFKDGLGADVGWALLVAVDAKSKSISVTKNKTGEIKKNIELADDVNPDIVLSK